MSKYSTLIKAAVVEINNSFEAAQNDLYRIVGEINKALKDINNAFEIDIRIGFESINGVAYRIVFDIEPNNLEAEVIAIAQIWIPSRGYPIAHGKIIKNRSDFITDVELHDTEALDSFFVELLSNPDSTLVQGVGYAMRKQSIKNQRTS